MAKPTKLTMAPTLTSPRPCSCTPKAKIPITVRALAARLKRPTPGPSAAQDFLVLRFQDLPDQLPQRGNLGHDPREALHHHMTLREHVPGAFANFLVELLPPLRCASPVRRTYQAVEE